MQEIPEDALSYISPIGYANSTKCGYCGRRGKSFSYYANSTSLTPELYQNLLNKAWRRSGNLLYRPNPRDSCCPHYTIRLDAEAYNPNSDQRRAVNRFNKFVLGENYIKEAARRYPLSREQARKRDTTFDLAERVHESEAAVVKSPPAPKHSLVVTLEEDTFTEEKYNVYENYQRVVHHEAPEEISQGGFKRFLCSSPLLRRKVTLPDGREKLLGSYHQCYRLDGKLVAIGVLDLLPQCVSSVYFLYHEDIHTLSPGKVGAVREIALAREFDYRWWYPGFYIHSCPKMRYKVDFKPQQILDPEALTWDPLDKHVLGLLDQKPYLSLASEKTSTFSSAETEDAAGQGSVAAAHGSPGGGQKRTSLFSVNMPGVPSFSEILAVNMNDIPIKLPDSDGMYVTSDLVIWHSGPPIMGGGGLKDAIAELVAAMGVDVMDQFVLDFSQQ